jgi:excisionase family DNA binding protein
MEAEKLYYVRTVARLLGLGKRQVYNLIAAGKLRAVKFSERQTRVPASAVQEYQERLNDP